MTTRSSTGSGEAPAEVFDVFPDPLGWALAVARGGRLVRLTHEDTEADALRSQRDRHGAAVHAPGVTPLTHLRQQLDEYFRGERRDFALPLAPAGTDFQLRVWEALCRIPFGETRTYGELAADAGSPRAFRAVGQANGRNPLAVVIPCHRVIAAGGRIGGYTGGLDRKRRLLGIEGCAFRD